LTTESDSELEKIERHARAAFAFLDPVSLPSVEFVRTAGTAQLNYLLAELFVEVEIDWKEKATFVLVGLPVEGARPDGYYFDKQGRHVRWHLVAALTAGGHHEQVRLLKSLTRKSGFDAMLKQIDAYSAVVRNRLDELPGLIRGLQH
jgi:hypothetical protein